MRIFYYCYGSAHSSVVAASIHVGLLPSDRVPVPDEFISLPHYDKTNSYEIGTPFFMGKDEFSSDVFIIGMKSDREVVKKAILSFLKHSGINTDEVFMVDTLKNVNIKTKAGGFISRRLGFVKTGRPLTIEGICEKYHDFVELVNMVKSQEKERLNIT